MSADPRRLDDALLAAAPELAVVSIVERALEVLVVALRVEHPTLGELDDPHDPPSLRRARQLLDRIVRTRGATRRYTHAVRSALALHSADHLPF